MNKTTQQLLQQLNTMQSNHIKTLEERIKVISEHRKHLNETISNQAHQLEEVIARSERRRVKLIEQKEHIEYQNKEINALKQLQNLKE